MNHESRINNKIKTLIHNSLFIIQSRGFTLIELVVVFSVMAVLSAVGIAGYNNYNNARLFQAGTTDVTIALNVAKSRTLSQTKPTRDVDGNPVCNFCSLECKVLKGWGVDTTTGSEYKLLAYCEPSNIIVVAKKLPTSLSFRDISGCSPPRKPSIFFPVLTGSVREISGCSPAPVPPLEIVLESSSTSKTIKIDRLGGITVL